MPRIAGVDLPLKKKVWVALTYIYGVGQTTASQILKNANVDGDKRVDDLNPEEVSRLQKVLDGLDVEGTLRKDVRDNIERLKRIGSYRGSRHSAGLPARGQRTKTNARTGRGRRKTVGAMTKEMAQKMEEAKKKSA
ncbi:30S ribosomal protein S13 [Candidatus Woesebacteria bacterium]|nr:30S ribosomal protein S13 [Candidatus Woesebacteria bacterium]MCD8507622.1 30S ribosomal protein S13 [Candidatus Woesebacteria bacterium]MCD8526792.1 30S ribosomal protein S13 [Candidatus Woesebacteria bacterium]MCD8546462.1 30S ribosomal protein S13 [Candidatus Woesebacteria bacterium]